MKLEEAGLIEDYFVDNSGEPLDVGLDGSDGMANEIDLVDPFCITGPSVLLLELTVSTPEEMGSEIELELLIGDVVVATATEDTTDEANPNLTLAYRGSVEEESEVSVAVIQ